MQRVAIIGCILTATLSCDAAHTLGTRMRTREPVQRHRELSHAADTSSVAYGGGALHTMVSQPQRESRCMPPLLSLVPVLLCRLKTSSATPMMHVRPAHFMQPYAVMAQVAHHSAAIAPAGLSVSNTCLCMAVCQRILATTLPGG